MELEKSLGDTLELRLVQFIHIYREAGVTNNLPKVQKFILK